MTYLLDTNTCIYYLTGKYPEVRTRLLAHRPVEIGVPAIVQAELLYGAQKSAKQEANLIAIGEFLAPFRIVAFDEEATSHYAELRAALEREGTPIGPNDMVIAATALSTKTTLVTHNTSEFSRVDGLGLEDWTVVS